MISPCLITDSVDVSFAEPLSTESAELQACAYVCGYLLKRKKDNCQKCDTFKKNQDIDCDVFNFMQFKEYDLKKSLIYASNDFVNCVESCATIINDLLRTRIHTVEIKQTINKILYKNVNFRFINCHYNENIKFIVNNLFYICVKRFCTLKNR